MSTQQRVSSNIDHPYVRGAGAWFAAALLLGAGLASNGRAADVALPARPVQPATGRVDIRDFGASGSEAWIRAAIAEGKTGITVDKPKDFQPGQGVTLSPALIRYDNVRIYEPETMYKTQPVTIGGNFTVGNNRITGFDESGSAAVAVQPDPLGHVWPCAPGANTIIAARAGSSPRRNRRRRVNGLER